MRLGNMAKSISVAAAHRTETEEAPISEEEPQVSQLGRPHRYNAAPSNMTGTGGRVRLESKIANAGRNTVGTNDKIVSTARSIAEADRNTIMILLQHGPLYSDERPDPVPKILQIDLVQQFTMLIVKAPAMQHHSAIRNGTI